MLVLLLVVVFNTSKLTHKKTNILDVWMEVIVCIWINFSKHSKKEREREKRGGVHQTNTNYHLLEVLVFLGCVGVLDRQPTTGSTRSRWMWLGEIGNSKEETRGTQFRQVRAARCVIPYVLYAA
jgi:hypothetical protein